MAGGQGGPDSDVSVGQVYLAKFRVGALIKKEIRRLETSEIAQ